MSRLPSLGPRGEGWLLLQTLLLVAIAVAAMASPLAVDGSTEQIARMVGLVGIVGGLIVFGLGIATLGSSLSPLPKPLASAELVERGIYRLIRHPIYTGLVLAGLGGSIYSVSPLALLFTVVLAVVLDLKARREEIWLGQQYAGYAGYVTRTKKFIPGVY